MAIVVGTPVAMVVGTGAGTTMVVDAVGCSSATVAASGAGSGCATSVTDAVGSAGAGNATGSAAGASWAAAGWLANAPPSSSIDAAASVVWRMVFSR